MTRATTHIVLLLLAAIVTTLLLRLGFWQLERGDEKKVQQQRYTARLAMQAVPLDSLFDAALSPQALRYRRVVVAGSYDSTHQFLLDNRTENGVAGYHVYTPLARGDGPVVLVNRGFVPVGPRRDRLPDLSVDEGPRDVRGMVDLPSTKQFTLGDAGYQGNAWPRVVQKLDPELVAAALGRPVAPIVVLLDPSDGDGFSRRWTPYLGISPERHQGYAVQWFALAATLTVIAAVLSWRSLRAKRPHE